MSVRVIDVSRVASRRRDVWRGALALRVVAPPLGGIASSAVLALLVTSPLPGGVAPAISLVAAMLVAVSGILLARRLRTGQSAAGRVAAVLAVALQAVPLIVVVPLVGGSGPRSSLLALVAAAAAWSARSLAAAARAVADTPATGRTTAVLGLVLPAVAAAAIVVIAAAGIRHADLLGRAASNPAIGWWVFLLAVAIYHSVRTVAAAPTARAEPMPVNSSSAAGWVPHWEQAGRGARFMYGTALGAAGGLFLGFVGGGMLLVWAAFAGPLILPLLIVAGLLYWRFTSATVRMLGRLQLRRGASFVGLGEDTRLADVLYLRSFAADRWRVRAQPIRHPAGKFGRPPFEEVVIRRLWLHGTVVAAEQPRAFAALTSPIGAAKRQLTNEGWQVSLVQWMRDARLIVVTVGRTSGLLWELEQLERLELGDKLFFVIPPVQRRRWWPRQRRSSAQEITEHWRTVNDAVAQVTQMSLPRSIDVARTRAVVPGVDGAAAVIVSRADRDFEYEVAVETAAAIIFARSPALRAPRRPRPA